MLQGVGYGQTDANQFVFGMIIEGGVNSVVAQDTFVMVTNRFQAVSPLGDAPHCMLRQLCSCKLE